MKNSKEIWASIVVAALLVAGPVAAFADQAMPSGPVLLKLNWPVGRHAVSSIDMKVNSTINTPMSPQPMSQAMTMAMQSTLVVSADPASGKRDLEMKYTGVKIDIGMNGTSMMSYDSAAAATGGANPMAATLGKMIGAKISFVLSADNHVESVQGFEELAQTVAPAGDPNSAMMKGLLNPDALKQSIDFSKYLPGKPVQPGDSWPVHLDYPMGTMGTMVMDYKCTLTAWEKHGGHWCAKITTRGTLNSKPGASPEMAGMKGMKMNFHGGVCTGESWFDLTAGMFVDSTVNLDVKIDMTMPNPMAQQQPSAPADITMQDAMHQAISTKIDIQ